jgi:hypothetical protein
MTCDRYSLHQVFQNRWCSAFWQTTRVDERLRSSTVK